MGSAGWPAKQWQYYSLNVRGSEGFDPPHRHVRNRKGAEYRSGTHLMHKEWVIVMSWLHGPFGSEANYRIFIGAANEIWRNFGSTWQVYVEFYPWIVEDLHDVPPPGFGTEAHMAAQWKDLPSLPVFHRMGNCHADNRWDSFDQKLRAIRLYVSVMAMVLVHIEVSRGIVKSIDDIPFFGGDSLKPTIGDVDSEPESGPPPGAAGSSTAPPRAVSASKHTVEDLRP